jgi:hypothetical protein
VRQRILVTNRKSLPAMTMANSSTKMFRTCPKLKFLVFLLVHHVYFFQYLIMIRATEVIRSLQIEGSKLPKADYPTLPDII